MTRPTPEPATRLRALVAQRETFGAYARLLHVTGAVLSRVLPELQQMRQALEHEIAPALPGDDDTAALVTAVHAIVDSPARMIEALLPSLQRHAALLPDLPLQSQPQADPGNPPSDTAEHPLPATDLTDTTGGPDGC